VITVGVIHFAARPNPLRTNSQAVAENGLPTYYVHVLAFVNTLYTGWPKKVSHYQVSSSNRINNRH